MDLINIISVSMGILGIIIGILGAGFSYHYGRKYAELQRKIKRFDWGDVEWGIKYLVKEVFSKFDPDIILTVSTPGAIIANLINHSLPKLIPLYSAIPFRRKDIEPDSLMGYQNAIITTKWKIFIPDGLFLCKGMKLLYIDCAVLTGDTLRGTIKLLLDNGFIRSNILSAVLLVNETAFQAEIRPDVYWIKISDTDYYMPWGKLLGPAY